MEHKCNDNWWETSKLRQETEKREYTDTSFFNFSHLNNIVVESTDNAKFLEWLELHLDVQIWVVFTV